jgi:hypothetical protein
MLVSFGINHPAYLCMRVSFVFGGSLSAKGFPFCAALFRERDTLDAAPALGILGQYPAHLFDGVMTSAVVAESSFRHQIFLTGSGGPLGRVGLFVRPMDTEQPATMIAT